MSCFFVLKCYLLRNLMIVLQL